MTDNLPVPDDLPYLNLSAEEINQLRNKKHELTEYGKQKLRELMNDPAITSNFDEWFEYTSGKTTQNSKEEITDYVNQIKDYVDEFMMMPVVLYNNRVITAKTHVFETQDFSEVVEHLKEIKENNKIVLLYEISKPEVLEAFPFECYRIRYGVLND